MTYADYLIKITETMKIRSTNYRLSSNDITFLANDVYQEIASECSIEFLQQNIVIDRAQDTYDLDALYTFIGNEIPLEAMSIQDEDKIDVSKFFKEINPNVFKISTFSDETNAGFLSSYDTKTITFNRSIIPDITVLSYKQQILIFNALIEGMMWYTHDSIPNPTASNSPAQETNMHYQRYSAAKAALTNKLVQRI